MKTSSGIQGDLSAANISATATAIAAGSASLPPPTIPQARYPLPGSITFTPRARSVSTFARVAGCSHIFTFIAGATITGAVVASNIVDKKSSASPCANFASISAVAGATISSFVVCASQICSIGHILSDSRHPPSPPPHPLPKAK